MDRIESYKHDAPASGFARATTRWRFVLVCFWIGRWELAQRPVYFYEIVTCERQGASRRYLRVHRRLAPCRSHLINTT